MENTNIANIQIDDLALTPEQTAFIDKVIEYYEPKIGNPDCWISWEDAKKTLRRYD